MTWRSQLSALFVVQKHNPTLRSSIFSMLCTGLPFIAGLIFSRPLDGMLAAILGMLLMLNDFGGDLRQRVHNQLLMIAAFFCGCLLVALVHFFPFEPRSGNHTLLFFIFLVLTAFGTGWAQNAGKLLEAFVRNITLALLVISELPYLDMTLVLFIFSSAVLSLLARILDHRLVPRETDASIAPIVKNFHYAWQGANTGLRYASVYSLCITGGLLLGIAVGTSKPYWVAITVMMTMRPDAALNFVRSLQRTAGTIIGVAIAALIVHYVQDLWWVAAIILLLGLALPHGIQMNYALHSSVIALFVLLLYTVASMQYGGDAHILHERIYDVILGCCIALVGTVLAFPRQKKS